jgi:hypothetical protein
MFTQKKMLKYNETLNKKYNILITSDCNWLPSELYNMKGLHKRKKAQSSAQYIPFRNQDPTGIAWAKPEYNFAQTCPN